MNKNKIIIIVVILIITSIISYLYITQNNSKEFDCKIAVTGKYTKTINCSDLKELKTESKSFTMKTTANKREEKEYQVVKITDFLEASEITNYNQIIVESDDGFKATLEKEDITTSYFGVRADDKEDDSGLSSIVPNKGSKFWVKNIVKIEVE